MEIKKPSKEEKNVQEEALRKFKLRDWIADLKTEIKTIHWTSKEELRVYTQIVVAGTFFFGMGVYLVDLAIHSALNILNWITRLIV